MAEPSRKILIIDDDPHITKLISLKLSANGYRTLTSQSGLEGIKIALKELPDLIILDVMMPQMDGYQVCRFLKSVPALSGTHIIFLTVKKGAGDRQRGLLGGGDDYVIKPFSLEELEEKIRNQLERERPEPVGKNMATQGPSLPPADAITDQDVIFVMNRLLDENVYRLTLLGEVSKRLVAAVDRETILRTVVTSAVSEAGLGWDRVILMMVDFPQRLLRAELAAGIYERSEDGVLRWREFNAAIKDRTLKEILDGDLERFYLQYRSREKWMDRFTSEVDTEKLLISEDTPSRALETSRLSCFGDGLEEILNEVFGVREISMVPIAGKEKIFGFLAADRYYSQRGAQIGDLGHLEILCHQAGLALERNELLTREQLRSVELEKLTLLSNSIMNSTDLGITYLDRHGKVGSWNRAMSGFTRLKEDEVQGRAFLEIFPELARTLVGERLAKAQATGSSKRVGHFQHRFTNAPEGIFDVRISIVRDKNTHLGTVLIWEGVRKRIELETRARETLQYLSNLINHSGDAILTMETDGKIKTWNHSAESIFGYPESEVVGGKFSILFEPGSKRDARDLLRRTIQEGKIINLEENLFSRKQEMVNVSITTSTIRGESDEVVAISAIIRDTSERKRMESQFFQTEKLASLGIMAAGMAHEINNPLTSIMMYAQILGMNRTLGDEDRKCLERIEEDTGRIANIVNSLLVFARPTPRRQEEIGLHTVLDKAVSFIEYQSLVRDIHVRRSYDPQVGSIMGIENEVQEIFLNLLMNARDALSQSGEIRITTALPPEPGKLQHDFPEGYVEVTVTDNGEGIPKENLKKIFDPFFTTKPPGKGTGLGLAVIRRLVDTHRGQITVRSEPGQGTTFTVLLPLKRG